MFEKKTCRGEFYRCLLYVIWVAKCRCKETRQMIVRPVHLENVDIKSSEEFQLAVAEKIHKLKASY